MSLQDGLLRDALLQTVMKQDVYLAKRTDNPLSGGAGTLEDPFDASTYLKFDEIMRNDSKTPPGSTVRLLPGIYETWGFDSSAPTQGWRPKSGMRICGSGVGTDPLNPKTMLRRVDSAMSGSTTVVGMDHTDPAQFLDGFEISDLAVDCGYTSTGGTGLTFGGISIRGRNILVQRVCVFNLGCRSDSTVPAIGISIARATSGPAYEPENCVIDSCSVIKPGGAGVSGVIGLHLSSETNGYYHYSSVVRNCYVDLREGSSLANYVGIAAGGGVGTIIEHNRFINVSTGALLPNANSTRDLIFRHNYFRRVATGFELHQTSNTLERLILMNNVAEWDVASGTPAPFGVRLHGAGTFDNVLIRDNVFRRMNNEASNNQEKGIDLASATWWNAIVDNNIVDPGTEERNGIRHGSPSGASFNPFNNLRSDGTLVRGYNTVTEAFDPELTTLVQDALA